MDMVPTGTRHPVFLPGLDRADLFVVLVHVVVEEADDSGLR